MNAKLGEFATEIVPDGKRIGFLDIPKMTSHDEVLALIETAAFLPKAGSSSVKLTACRRAGVAAISIRASVSI